MTMLGALLRGARSRALLNVGSLLLTALAIGSAILGPSFQDAVTNSYAITRLGEAPVAATGISRIYAPDQAQLRAGPEAVEERARAVVSGLDEGPWHEPDTTLVSPRYSALRGLVTFWSRAGSCEHLEIVGRCPQAPGEVLMLTGDAEQNGVAPGDTVTLPIFEPTGLHGRYPRAPIDTVTLVGTYSAPEATEEEFWYALPRLTSNPEQVKIKGAYQPYAPAPLITVPETFALLGAEGWTVRVDTRLDVTAGLTTTDLRRAVAAAGAVPANPVEVDGGTLVGDQILGDLAAVDQEIGEQQETARASIAPAVLSVVLVALALLLRLLTSASELRVPELALASLRGLSARRLWGLGLAEPLLVLVLAIPFGLALGAALSVGLVRWWLLPDLPVPLPSGGFVAAAAVLLAAVVVAVAAVGMVVQRSLASALTGVRRPGAPKHWTVLIELTLVALALAVLFSKLAGGTQSDPDSTDLVLPVLLAVVAGLGATRLVALVARWWSRHNGSRRSLSGYISSRALSRRTEGTLVILPITAAVAIAVFGVGVHDSAAVWRASVAATVAPASTVWTSPLPLNDTVELTRRLDPDGASIMAAASVAGGGVTFSVVDASRLAAVATWPESWSPEYDVEQVAAAITPPGVVPTLTGRRLEITMDNRARTSKPIAIELRMGTRAGRPVRAYLGPFPAGVSTRSVRLPGCAQGCPLEGFSVAGGAGTTMEMDGRVVLSAITVDGAPVPGIGQDAAWGTSPDSEAASAVTALQVDGDSIALDLDSRGESAMARLVAGGIPRDRAVMVGVDVSERALESLASGAGLPPVGVVGRVESTPFAGPQGLLIDYASFTIDRPAYDNLNRVRVLMNDQAPQELRDRLSAAGLTVESTQAAQQRILDQGAYALAMRLYAVVAALVLLMALAGLVVSSAVQLPSRRRDAAALRVVGVPRRSVTAAVARELSVVLGAAALAGVLAGSLAQYVVLRTITLGYVEDLTTPALVATIDPGRLVLLAVLATTVLGVLALTFAVLTVRGVRGSTLRESAR